VSDALEISVVLPDLRLGGAQRVLLELSRRFAMSGHDVDVVTLCDDGELTAQIPDGVHYRPLLPSAKRGAGLALAALPRLVRYLSVRRPDVVLSTMTGTNLLTAIAHLVAGSPGRLALREAVSLHNTPSAITRWLMSVLYRRADVLLAVSSGVADELTELVGRRTLVHRVPNPIDEQRVRAAAAAGPTHAPQEPYVVCVGRLAPQKDQSTLLRAYAASALRRTHRLAIVGDGERRASLLALVRELGVEARVDFLGGLSNPYPILAGAALLVLSSRWEGWPNVLLEALALGVPVVATDCPSGPREILEDGRLGRLTPVGDHLALASAMDAELCAPTAKRPDALAAYRPEAVARRYLSLMLHGAAETGP
jgi:glycosyltransferase involved in cell wall biosynthesis